MTADLLPLNATPLERALDRVDAARVTTDPALVAAVWNPDTCPAELLGYLAWALSVDIWDPAWPELRKRDVCRRSFALHRSKTTVAGIRAHLDLADATLLSVRRPPSTCFVRDVVTDAAREDWLAALPQIRIYPFVAAGTARRRLFACSPRTRRQFLGASWLRASRGHQLIGRRATWFDRGVERPIAQLTALDGGVSRVALPSIRRRTPFYGHGHLRGHLRAIDAAANIVTFRLSDDATVAPIRRGTAVEAVKPVRVAVPRTPSFLGDAERTTDILVRRGAPPRRAFLNRFRGFMGESAGPRLVFDRVSLQDPDRFPARRFTRAFHGHSRFGISPFTAELRVAVPMRRARRVAFRWHGVGHLRGADMAPLARAREAIGVSRAARDTVLIDTATMARASFGAGLQFGNFTFGERTRIT